LDRSRKEEIEGKFQGVCRPGRRILVLMSQRIGPSVTSLLPEKRRPGAGGRSLTVQQQEWEGWSTGCPRLTGRGAGLGAVLSWKGHLRVGAARGGRAPAGKARDRGATSPGAPVRAADAAAPPRAFRL
jgi:hypothetical protein